MKVVVNNKDISQIVSKIIWSGTDNNVARKLEIDVVYSKSDYYFNQLDINVNEGSIIFLKDHKDNIIFRGVIIDLSYSESGSVVSYTAFDFMFYVNNSEICLVKKDTAESISKEICRRLGIKTGHLISTGIKQYQAYLHENAYKAIFNAYKKASQKTGEKYRIEMHDDKLEVRKKGLSSGIVLDENYNLIDASYKISLSNLVNKVLVIDKTGKVLEKIEDTGSMKKYGTVQKITENKEDAKGLISGIEKTMNVSGIGDIRATTGKSLIFKDSKSGKDFIFYIKSDSHTFTDSGSTMSLELSLKNTMEG